MHFFAYFLDERPIEHWSQVLLAALQLSQLFGEEIALLLVLLGPTQAVLVLQALFVGQRAWVAQGRHYYHLLRSDVRVWQFGRVVFGQDRLGMYGSEAGV